MIFTRSVVTLLLYVDHINVLIENNFTCFTGGDHGHDHGHSHK